MNQDFVDLLREFSDHDVAFLVVGARALAAHAHEVEVLEDALVFHLDFAEPAKLVEVCVGDVTVPVGPRDAHVEVRVARQPQIAFVVRSRQGAELHETFALVEETKGA